MLTGDPVVVAWLMTAGAIIVGPLCWWWGRRSLRREFARARFRAHKIRAARAALSTEKTRYMAPVEPLPADEPQALAPEQTQYMRRVGDDLR